MRGFFGIGIEGISKPYNSGAIFRTSHAFGASFVFTVKANYSRGLGARVDTSKATEHIPFYEFDSWQQLVLPKGVVKVGVELVKESIELPSFRHPSRCVYILGPERGNLSEEAQQECKYIIKIPTKFCLNVGMATGIVLYDRMLSFKSFKERPVRSGAIPDGDQEFLSQYKKFAKKPFDYDKNNF